MSDRWFRCFRPMPDAKHRLACFPHAGGSATAYLALSRAVAPDVEVVAAQYPGRQDRRAEPPVTSIDGLADSLTSRLLLTQQDRPLALFGHSMGATLGFEIARRLTAHGEPPVCLFVSGRQPPSRQVGGSVHLRDDDGLLAELRGLNGTDTRLLADEQMVRLILPTVRSDYIAAETYRYVPSPPLPCPIVALLGDSDARVRPDEAQGWRDHTTGAFELRLLPGGHFYLTDTIPQLRQILLETLGR